MPVPESKLFVPVDVGVPSPKLMVAVYGAGFPDSGSEPPGSVTLATGPVELTPRPAENVRFVPLCTTAGSETVAVLFAETVDVERVMLVWMVSEPAALKVWLPLTVKMPDTESKVMVPTDRGVPSPQLIVAE